MARGLAVITVMLCALAWAPAARAAAPVFGFEDYGSLIGQYSHARGAELQAQAGGKVHRLFFDWMRAEKREGQVDWTTHDAVYAADLAAGIRPIFSLQGAPPWTWAIGTMCDTTRNTCRYPPRPGRLDAWRRIVTQMVQRYPQMAALEIWNEPNLARYYAPAPNAAYYVRLVSEAHRAAKAAGSSIPVIAGSLSNFAGPDSTSNVSYKTFTKQLYDNGLAGNLGGFSIHAYPGDVDLWIFFQALNTVRDLREKAGDRTPLWIGELGQSTIGPTTYGGALSEPVQGALVTKILSLASEMPDIAGVILHTLTDDVRQPSTSVERGYGALSGNLSPKPLYCALAVFNRTGYVCPAGTAPAVVDAMQQARWEAQVMVERAMAAARIYRRAHGSYAGIDSAALHAIDPRISATPAKLDQRPGPGNDPSRVFTLFASSGGVPHLLVCNTSTAERHYCIVTAFASLWRYGTWDKTLQEAATATWTGAAKYW